MQDYWHEFLEYSRGIGQTKRHDIVFVQISMTGYSPFFPCPPHLVEFANNHFSDIKL